MDSRFDTHVNLHAIVKACLETSKLPNIRSARYIPLIMDIVKHLMAEDIYQYRKYGAKKETQSRDSTRHYFRCKVEDCPSRKIIEVNNRDGSYTVEVRGEHNHKPDAPAFSAVPSKRSSEEHERLVTSEEQSLTRSKRASAQNVSHVIRLVRSASQQVSKSEHASSPRDVTSPRSLLDSSHGGSPRARSCTPCHDFCRKSSKLTHSEICAAVKREPSPVVPAGTPVDSGASPQRSFTPAVPRYGTPDHHSLTPMSEPISIDPSRIAHGGTSLATAAGSQLPVSVAATGVPTSTQMTASLTHFSHPDALFPAVKPFHKIELEAGNVVHEVPDNNIRSPDQVCQATESSPVAPCVTAGAPEPILTPSRNACSPDTAPPTPASAAGTSCYPGHEGVPVNDPRVTVREWRSDEGVLGLLFNGTEKEYSDAYCWRKYGKKSIKGHQNPRFYWRCTHKSCDIKRHTQATEDGFTEIRYYGRHCHSPPPHKSSRGRARNTTAQNNAQGGSSTIAAPSSPRSEVVAASSGASPIPGPLACAGDGTLDSPNVGVRSRFMRTARLRAPATRMLLHSDDEDEPPCQRQRTGGPGDTVNTHTTGGNVPANLSRCPLYFLACVAANQAR